MAAGPGERADSPSFSALSAEPELPRLVSDTRPFLCLVEGVPGVAGVRPPDDGVRLGVPDPGVLVLPVPGVPGVLAALEARSRPCMGAWCLPLRCVGVR